MFLCGAFRQPVVAKIDEIVPYFLSAIVKAQAIGVTRVGHGSLAAVQPFMNIQSTDDF